VQRAISRPRAQKEGRAYTSNEPQWAEGELRKIDEIIDAEKPAKEKCSQIWHLIRGE
jgi:hypothetical protein